MAEDYETFIKRILVERMLELESTPPIEHPTAKQLLARLIADAQCQHEYYEAAKKK